MSGPDTTSVSAQSAPVSNIFLNKRSTDNAIGDLYKTSGFNPDNINVSLPGPDLHSTGSLLGDNSNYNISLMNTGAS